ncbi:MAG: UDP-2,3-diacylglucosamine diphosphatase [Gammaproteobacteria bacterium]|nr:UDP-2,3-diacylglucosamine diphosphatase [Gammaproteobacteria bacterium]
MTEFLFISDLHLDPTRPAATEAFLDFLQTEAHSATRLYILGDLFEFWIGDDDDDDLAATVLGALRKYTGNGHDCRVMSGNRDFLLGSRFERETGARLLDDPVVEDIFGERVLLSHGDQFCTADRSYQRYRRIIRNPLLQRLFLSLPRNWRRAAGTEGRRRSRRYAESSAPHIMDVCADTIRESILRFRVNVIVHGHTHRPAIHPPAALPPSATRIVLGDWYEHGSVLKWSASGYQLKVIPFG